MAGFFGLFNYSKPGPGVSKDEPKKKRFFLFFELYFRKFWKLMALNLLYILACIPIVTIGPATAGMSYILRNYAREQHAFPLSDFWDNFKSNFKQGFAIGLIDLVCFGMLAYALPFYFNALEASWFYYIPFALCTTAGVLLLFANFYIFMMMVTFRFTVKQLLKNGFIFACVGMRTNFITLFWILLICVGLPALALITAPIGLVILVLLFFLIIPITVLFIINFNVYPHINKHLIIPAMAEKEEAEKKAKEEARAAMEAAGEAVEEEDDEPVFTDQGRELTEKEKKKDGDITMSIRCTHCGAQMTFSKETGGICPVCGTRALPDSEKPSSIPSRPFNGSRPVESSEDTGNKKKSKRPKTIR
ncbi:MAG: YesL family protein [Oscillospiraceae bacterium]|nr:YesL family protein [Oscillospiraceae bacterium]